MTQIKLTRVSILLKLNIIIYANVNKLLKTPNQEFTNVSLAFIVDAVTYLTFNIQI